MIEVKVLRRQIAQHIPPLSSTTIWVDSRTKRGFLTLNRSLQHPLQTATALPLQTSTATLHMVVSLPDPSLSRLGSIPGRLICYRLTKLSTATPVKGAILRQSQKLQKAAWSSLRFLCGWRRSNMVKGGMERPESSY